MSSRRHITALSTRRLELTPLDPEADAPSLHQMYADPEVFRYDIDVTASRSVEQTRSQLRRTVADSGGATWAIRLSGGPAIGTIGLYADQGDEILGLSWALTPSYWRRGITSEAAREVVPFLLARDGVEGVEAWVDSRNLASIGVARAAWLSERARLPRVYADHLAQTVVLARSAVEPDDPEVFAVVATLWVRDLCVSVGLLRSVLRLHVAWSTPDPPVLAALSVQPWSGSAGLRVQQTSGAIVSTDLTLEVGVSVDAVHDRVRAAGLDVVEPPVDRPWFRREMAFRLPEGHVLTVSGPR